MSTMTEREMLELAAKAAGYDVRFEPGHVIDAEERDKIIAIIYGHDYADDWSPLADDGDALRLAVTLRIEIGFFAGMVYAGPGGTTKSSVDLKEVQDMQAATRLAIVKAAAEIGRSKHE